MPKKKTDSMIPIPAAGIRDATDNIKTEHRVPIADLCTQLGTSAEQGLTAERAASLLIRDGPNLLTRREKSSELAKFFRNFTDGFSILLLVASLLCFGAYGINRAMDEDARMDNLYLGIILAVVVLINGSMQYYQERKSSSIMESFKSLLPAEAYVIRDGQLKKIPAEKLVVGDLVEVKGGQKIPADIRLTAVNGLKVDNSSFTGEAEPLLRSVMCTSDKVMDTRNLAFFSTNATEGTARGIVIRTGDRTVMGHLAQLTASIDQGQTTIGREIDHFVKIISIVACTLGALFFILALLMGYNFIQAVVFLIGIVVANVPQGLLATVTICLTLTAKRMASKHCLVKNLEAVETLGSTSVICTDKTGTLTQNKMTAAHLWCDRHILAFFPYADEIAARVKNEEDGSDAQRTPAFDATTLAAVLCNQAVFEQGQINIPVMERSCIGDATESALLRFAQRVTGEEVEVEARRQQYPRVAQIPFNSTNKFQVSVHLQPRQDGHLLVMKGAPERVIERCATILLDGVEVELNDDLRGEFNAAYEDLGRRGERVIGFADLQLDQKKYPKGFAFHEDGSNIPLDGLRFVGLASLIDPPRRGVAKAVSKCRSASIKVVMVTGDHPTTAEAIARQVGIITSETVEDVARRRQIPIAEVDPNEVRAVIVHGDRLREMEVDELSNLLDTYEEIVFARTSPQQKLKIVEGFQRQGHVVAVTGDGVNDSPALKQADIGIAMGITGSEVSKEAADMVLLNDDFSSIVKGVKEGRLIFDNLKKSIAYTLTSNIPELLPFIAFILLGIPLPLGTIAILCIDLGTDMWPAISLAYEKAESDIMKRPPRNPKYDRLVNAKLLLFCYLQIGIIQAAAGFFTYFVVMADNGFYPRDLIGIRSTWYNTEMVIDDSYGQPWTYNERMDLEYTCHTAYFIAIVVVQWADLLIAKTRRNSIVQQGMSNWCLNWSLVFVTLGAYSLTVLPGMDVAMGMYPLRFHWWFAPVPFALAILIYDELRKFFIRRYPGGWMERATYY